jgi:hypothetical protein
MPVHHVTLARRLVTLVTIVAALVTAFLVERFVPNGYEIVDRAATALLFIAAAVIIARRFRHT